MRLALGFARTAPLAPRGRAAVLVCALIALTPAVRAQQPQPDNPPPPVAAPVTPAQDATQAPAQAPSQTVNQTPSEAPAATVPGVPTATTPGPNATQAGAITEEQLKQMLVGKQFYLRGGYLGDTLNFDEHGRIVGHSPKGSYTLSIVQIDHVRLTKHKVEMEATRFGLHFNEQLAYEDSSTAFDKVRITPRKKVVRITIDRELVVNPRKKKESGKQKAPAAKPLLPGETAAPAVASGGQSTTPGTNPAAAEPTQAATSSPAASPAAGAPDGDEPSEAEQLKASIAAAPEAERPADPSSVTTTTSPAHANQVLRDAIDATFAAGLDDRMMAAMPDFWKLYYQSVAAKADYRPSDPSILRQNTVDEKAHLLTSFEPDSNDFAQAAGVAGMALYHTVIGSDGKPGEIAVARPIGFGLDENAVAAIRKAKFSPAIKDGKPVPVMLDLVVQFRIFSERTAAQGNTETAEKEKPAGQGLPGPYSVPHP